MHADMHAYLHASAVHAWTLVPKPIPIPMASFQYFLCVYNIEELGKSPGPGHRDKLNRNFAHCA